MKLLVVYDSVYGNTEQIARAIARVIPSGGGGQRGFIRYQALYEMGGHLRLRRRKNGATLVMAPQPFYVKGKEGPLKEGELERAATWARGLLGKQGEQ